jgi:hypothetical protein
MSISKTLSALPWQIYAVVGVGVGVYLAGKKLSSVLTAAVDTATLAVSDTIDTVTGAVKSAKRAVVNTTSHVVNPFAGDTPPDTARVVLTQMTNPLTVPIDSAGLSAAYDYIVGKTTDLIEYVAPITPSTPAVDIPLTNPQDTSGW